MLDTDQAHDESANAVKAFLTIIAHDLRSALNACFLWLDIVELGVPLTEETAKATKAFRRSLEKQAKLIGHFVDAGEISAGGTINIFPEIVDLVELVEGAVTGYRAMAAERGVRLELEDVAAADARAVTADRQRVKQAVGALLEYAIGVTPAGAAVSIAVTADSDEAEIAVSDGGPSIGAEELEQILVPFWKGRRLRQEGLGLGLVIAEHVVARHEGSLRAESGPVGGTLRMRLPLRRDASCA
jgi:two-component system sensor histidine kinase CreC